MGLYKKKATVQAIYEEMPTIFDALQLPDPLTVQQMRALILTECGELDTIFSDAEAMAAYLPVWNACELPGWERIAEALAAEYNPIHNYDRTDVETEEGSAESSSGSSGSSTNSGADTETTKREGFNSSDFVNADKRIMEAGTTAESSTEASSESSSERTRTLESSGNIGVTTSQQMIEAEIALRSKWTLAGIVLESFKKTMCVGVW